MPPQSLTLIRHAQGFHNLCEANHQLRDPQLTDLGKKQCAALSTSLPHLLSITLIVASPIKRTLYTALYTFATLLKQNPSMRIIALPDLQETSALPCDTGSDIPDLIEEFEGQPVDFSLLFEGWNEKSKAPYAPIPGLILARAGRVRKWLSEREEKEIAVVTHGGLLHFLTGDWSDHEIFPGRRRVFLNSGNVEGEGERAGVEGNGKGKQKEVLEEEVEWEYDLSRDGVPITGNGSLSFVVASLFASSLSLSSIFPLFHTPCPSRLHEYC
jgi:broad specificity phosphatase PhoE